MEKITPLDLHVKKSESVRITMLTAYDFHSAVICDQNGVDIVLVGDSLGRLVQGDDTNRMVTVPGMMYHTRIVSKGVRTAMVMADLPFKSYETPAQAVETASLLIEKGGADAVLMEGRSIAPSVQAVAASGIPVASLIGMDPGVVNEVGPFLPSKIKPPYQMIIDSALSLVRAGCFMLVLRTIPASLSRYLAKSFRIPVIGIGSGRGLDGQLLLFHDMMGIVDDFNPKHVKRYAHISQVMMQGIRAFVSDVEKGLYPCEDHEY